MTDSTAYNTNDSNQGDLPYIKFLHEGNTKFYENDFEGAIKSLNTAFRLGCNDRYAFWKRGIAKSKLGDHKGAHNDMVQFGFHLESDYMIKLLNEKIKENAYFTDEFILLISSSLNAQELKVITNRFGLVDGVFRTQREVGEFLGITPQRVSQIELKATKKIQVAKSLENLFEKK